MGDPHPSMPEPELVKATLLARHFEVPLTRCYVVVEHAASLDADIDWGYPSLVRAGLSDSTLRLESGSYAEGIRIALTDVDIRILVSGQPAGRLYRRVLRGWPIEHDRKLRRHV
jgi:hypothetical protein